MKKPDEIKKGLRHCSEDGCKRCPYEDDCHISDGGSELAADALEYIRQLEAHMPKWISVDERLPENQFLALAYVHNFYELVHWNAYDEIWEHEFGWFNKGEVSHWMPLPEPPKED